MNLSVLKPDLPAHLLRREKRLFGILKESMAGHPLVCSSFHPDIEQRVLSQPIFFFYQVYLSRPSFVRVCGVRTNYM